MSGILEPSPSLRLESQGFLVHIVFLACLGVTILSSSLSSAVTMHISSGCIVLLALPQAIVASPARLAPRDEGSAKITQMDTDPMARAKAVAVNRAGYQYAPSLMGKASYHLGGSLGEKRIESDLKLWLEDRNIVNRSLSLDVAAASAAVTAVRIANPV